MCSNQLMDSVECYMDEIFDTFEEFLKKSLVVVSIAIGTVVLLLIYVTNVASGRSGMPPCCLQSPTGADDTAQATGASAAMKAGAPGAPGAPGTTPTMRAASPCPPRPCPPPEDCPEMLDGADDECDGNCPNKYTEKRSGFFSRITCRSSNTCPSACTLKDRDSC